MSAEPDELDPASLARLLDVSAVQAWHTRADVEELARFAVARNCVNAHVLPQWVPVLRELIGSTPAELPTLVGAPVGFPSGGSATAVKLAEAERLLADGVQEMDVVLAVARLRSGDLSYVRDELSTVVQLVGGRVPVKVILEVGYLDDEQVRQGCRAAIDAGADFVKTGTGWSGHPTTLAHVRLISESAGDEIAIKASGGIRDLATVRAMVGLGVTRFGVNVRAAAQLLHEAAGYPHEAGGHPHLLENA